MLKQLIIGLASILFCGVIFAESCPSLNAIKTNQLAGWKALSDGTDQAITPAQMQAFKASVSQFALAEYDTSANHIGSIRCYYRDNTGSNLDTYLSKSNLALSKGQYWYQVTGSMQCAAGMDKCIS